ncbi:MAG: molybdopterin-guanine dinucleotide biosynthesis protein B [Pseudomonadota bacterium]
MPPIFGFCGAANSGKTTLVCAVVTELTRRGIKVGVIKHHGHGDALPPPPGEEHKDSGRLAAAGACRVALVHAGGVRLNLVDLKGATPLELAQETMSRCDLVLVEGYKSAQIDKIEVVAPGCAPLFPSGGRLLALTRRGGGGPEGGLPVLDADLPDQVAEFVLAQLPVLPLTRLWLDGRELVLNPFVQKIVAQTLRGLVVRLDGGSTAPRGRVEVRLG